LKPSILLSLALVFCSHGQAAILFPKAAEQYAPIAYRQTVSFYQASPPALFPKSFQTNNLELAMGHRCYVSDYKAVLSGKMLATATSSGWWEYLILCGTNAIGLSEVDPNDKPRGKVAVEFPGTGPPLPIWVALQAAEKLTQVKTNDYEFRFLWIGVDDEVQAIWLHGEGDDIIIPITHYPSEEWRAYWPYSESELIKLFKPHVESALKASGVY
jgi:hypothetical protein